MKQGWGVQKVRLRKEKKVKRGLHMEGEWSVGSKKETLLGVISWGVLVTGGLSFRRLFLEK